MASLTTPLRRYKGDWTPIQATHLLRRTMFGASDKYDGMNNFRRRNSFKSWWLGLMLAGGLQTPFYLVSLGGFDTHAKQTDPGDRDDLFGIWAPDPVQ